MTTMTAMNEVSMNELEQVSGGTVTEFEEICTAMSENETLKSALKTMTHVPIINAIDQAFVDHVLYYELGINATISLGFLGTGIGSDPNKYRTRSSSRPMTHQEVLDAIKGYGN